MTERDWFVTHKRAYDVDFLDLPKNLQKRATDAVYDLKRDPITPRGNTIKPLKGWENLWRYRLGDHRLIYSVAPESHVIQLLAIGPRGSVYERFNYDPDAKQKTTLRFDAELAAKLLPQEDAPPEWQQHPEWFRAGGDEDGDTGDGEPAVRTLPKDLTASRLSKWQIPDQYHDELMTCSTEDDLLEAAVPEEYIEQVLYALWPPSVERIATQPDQVLIEPEDMQRYAEGTLRSFLLHLDEHQRRYVDWALDGPTLIKGGPGSGKSTVALYRVRAIVEHALEETGELPEILFTTYTNALTNYSETLLSQLLRDSLGLEIGDSLPDELSITTVDKIVMWIARSSGEPFELAKSWQLEEALHYARSTVASDAGADLDAMLLRAALDDLRDAYLLDEFDWVIEGQNCRTLDDYHDAHRVGRGIPFHASLREAVWTLYTRYRDHLYDQDLRTWGQLRQLALDEVRAGNFTRRWDYVVVDEAQDLTPAALALCVDLCRDPTGLFLTADANQSLYNRGFRWKNVHEQLQVTGRTRILRRNYRSTREIALGAGELVAESTDPEALEQEYVHTGPPPALYAADGTRDQARWLAEQIRAAAKDLRLPVNAAAVLVPSNRLGRAFARQLSAEGLSATFMSSANLDLTERCVKVMTLHAAKGLEFPIVAIAHVDADRLPKEIDTGDAAEYEEHLKDQRRLLYVGCTRAMRYLFITCDRLLPSPFLEDLSEDRWLHFS